MALVLVFLERMELKIIHSQVGREKSAFHARIKNNKPDTDTGLMRITTKIGLVLPSAMIPVDRLVAPSTASHP